MRVRKDENKEIFVQELFRKLKDFYDINNKLSLKEAINDYGLLIKLLQLFTIFYNDTKLARAETNSYLRNLEKINLS
ncbi:MAG TPA: hypothetical protein VMW42_10980 [Desulfatiglandales bacterium]|nr:hypothetical protein [Desulfatiglandales bacterium]